MESRAYTVDDIGTFPGEHNPGDAVCGVKIFCNGELLSYAFDVWNHPSGDAAWNHVTTNINGNTILSTYYEYNASLIWLRSGADNTHRYSVYLPNLKNTLPPGKYSIVIDKMYLGKFHSRTVETPYDADEDLNCFYSMQKYLNAGAAYADCGMYDEECPSYFYQLYSILEIGKGADISTAGEGYRIDQLGEAYYDGTNYILQSLPDITPTMEGYQSTLLGWYDAPEGGKQYQSGDIIQKSTVLYPHWKKTALKYPVSCIDVLGDDASGSKLGTAAWEQEYDSCISGSQVGCIPLESMYYEGMVYTGCSEKTVRLSGNTVYRYFKYAEYPVQIIDQISGGPNSGQVIGTTSRWHPYGSVVDGGVLGDSREPGAYYPGYAFVHSSSDIVGRHGISVYRYFMPMRYTIHLDGNGAGSGSMASMEDCWYGQSYQLTTNAYKKDINISLELQAEEAVCNTSSVTAGQNFAGWAESSDGAVRYSDGASVENLLEHDGSRTLYAVWNPANVTITAQPERMGYRFAGWSEDPDAISGKTKFSLTEDTTLYAIWKADVVKYHVEYFKENLQGSYEQSANYQFSHYSGTKVSIQDSIPAYPGFYLDSGSSVLEGTVSGDGSLILVAYYRRNSYRISFEDSSGGSGELDDLELSGVFEEEIEIPAYTAKKEGYYFAGWTAEPDSGQIYCKPGDIYHIPNHDQKLYAVWKPNAYKIIFNANIPAKDEDQAQGSMNAVNGYYGEPICLPACSLTRRGYDFAGWNTKADGSGTAYRDAQEIESLSNVNSSNITLYAVWKPVETEIEYKANVPQGTSGVLSGSMKTDTVLYGRSIMIPECGYHLSGYDFVAWNTKADGSGQSFSPKDDVKRIFAAKGKNNLYAIWKAQDNTRFILRLEKEQPDGSTAVETGIYYGKTDAKVSDAIVAYYAEQGQEVTPTDFIHGYQLSMPEQLDEKRVTADGECMLTLKLIRKEYALHILRDVSDPEHNIYFEDSTKYQTRYTLPKEINGIKKIEQYIDAEGNTYRPGAQICIDGPVKLMIQHSLCYNFGNKQKEEYVLHDMPLVLEKPQETVYAFEGWYRDRTLRDYVGTGKSVIYLTEDTVLYPKWSEEKIRYQIRYLLGDGNDVVIIDGQTDSYCSGNVVVLPTASQVVVPEGFRFVGWYEQGDEHQTVCTEITKDQFGDKTYCLKLKKIEMQEGEDNKNPQTGDATGQPDHSSESKPDASTGTPAGAGVENNTGVQSGPSSSNSAMAKIQHSVSKQQSNQVLSKKITRKGIQYQIRSSSSKTLKVIRVKSNKKTVSIPDSITINGVHYKVTEIGSRAFQKCKNTQNIKLGVYIKIIRKKAFYGMKKLKKIVINSKKTVKAEKSIWQASGKKMKVIVPKKLKAKYRKVFQKIGYRRVLVTGK